MRRALLILSLASILALAAATPVAANNDPHRFLYEQTPFTLAAGPYCAFPVYVEFPVVRAYATETDLPDGTVILTIRGSAFMSATNLDTHKTVHVNSSGPGTIVISAQGAVTADLFGRGGLFAPNLVDFGLPSNFVAMAGPVHLTQTLPDPNFSSLSWKGAVITDICAALR